MAKKKKAAPPSQQQLSPEKYIQTKARSLPIVECLVVCDWEEIGSTPVLVARQHKSGNYTLGIYLIDVWCLGVKDSYYYFNVNEEKYEELKDIVFRYHVRMSISYNEAHNLIYGSVAFAEEVEVQPCKSFRLTSFLLEEDTDEIPLIEYDYGRKHKHFLVVDTELEADKYLTAMEKNGYFIDYTVLSAGGEPSAREAEATEKWLNRQKDKDVPTVEYAYVHPEYPQELSLVHSELEMLYLPKNNDFLSREDIETILALPRETLVADLEHLIRYEIGRTYKNVRELDYDVDYVATLLHALFLLGELRAEESLDTVLEVLRQDADFIDFHFGDSGNEVFPLTLYYVGRNQLHKFDAFAKEPHLCGAHKSYAFIAVRLIFEQHAERREEIIDWCRKKLNFFQAHTDDQTVFDGTLIGMFTAALAEMRATELLPELKEIYATDLIDETIVGDFDYLKYNMLRDDYDLTDDYPLLDIYKRYEEYQVMWGS